MQVNEIRVDADVDVAPVADGERENEVIESGNPVNEDSIDQTMEVVEQHELDREQNEEDLVALEAYYGLGKRLIETKTTSLETLQLLRSAISPYMKNKQFQGMALESDVTDIVAEHEIVLEGVKETIKSLLHSVGSAHIAIFDDFRQLFRSFYASVKTTRGQLSEAEKQFSSAMQGKPANAELHLDMHILNNFFNIGKAGRDQYTAILTRDGQFSTYVLGAYTASVVKELERLTSLLGSEKNFEQLVRKIAAMESPVDLFEKKWLMPQTAKDSYLCGYWVEADTPNMDKFKDFFRSDKNTGREASPLKHLAHTFFIKERLHSANAQSIGDRTGNPFGFMIHGATSTVLQLSPADVRHALALGEVYLKAVEKYLPMLNTIEAVWMKFEKAYEDYSLEGQNASKTEINQIHKYAQNLLLAVTEPGKFELHRAIFGARYCAMLANRATFVNA